MAAVAAQAHGRGTRARLNALGVEADSAAGP